MNEEIVNEVNLSLHTFLQAATEKESDDSLITLVEKQIEPIIKSIIRVKLRVSLQPDDDRPPNQDALDLVSEVKTLIIPTLRNLKAESGANKIENFEAYVKTITLNAYHQYLRKKYPLRLRLKNQLRYLLTHGSEFSLWKTENNIWACGFSDWQKRNLAPAKNEFSDELKKALTKLLSGQENYKEHSNIINLST